MHAATSDEIRQIAYFRSLSDAEAEAVAAETLVQRLQPREVVVVEGEEAKGLYFVRDGTLRIFRTGREGREQALRLASAGETFGEVPIFDGRPSASSVEAIHQSTVLLIPSRVCQEVVRRHPEVAVTLLGHFARRIRAFIELVEQISLQSVEMRLARYLFQLALVEGEETEEGIRVPRELTVHDLASLLGSVREVVARTMQALEKEGVIIVRRKEIVIRDMGMLRSLL